MRGARVKALRREYERMTGSEPLGVDILRVNEKTGEVAYKQSVWRMLKKEYNRFKKEKV